MERFIKKKNPVSNGYVIHKRPPHTAQSTRLDNLTTSTKPILMNNEDNPPNHPQIFSFQRSGEWGRACSWTDTTDTIAFKN